MSEDLYQKSRRAMQRYAKPEPMPKNDPARSFYRVKYEMFRIGWMIGYRAGRRARRAE